MIDKPKILILGIGNTIRGDDGVGIFAVRSLREHLDYRIDTKETESAGIVLLEMISGYDKAIIIDSICTGEGNPGDIYRITKDSLKLGFKPCSSHKMGLATIVEMAKNLGIAMPDEIVIYAIEIEKGDSFSDCLTAKVKEAIPKVMNLVEKELYLGGVAKL